MAEEKTEPIEEQKPAQSSGDPKVDAIKELIFGENMTEYNKRFADTLGKLEQVKTDLETKRKALAQTIHNELADTKKEIESRMTAIESTIAKEVARLEDKKTDRKAIGKMLQNIAEKLQA